MVWFWFFARVMTRVRHCLWRVVPVRLVVIVWGGGYVLPPGGLRHTPGGGYKSFDLYHAISLLRVGLVFMPRACRGMKYSEFPNGWGLAFVSARVEVVDECLDRDPEFPFAFGVGYLVFLYGFVDRGFPDVGFGVYEGEALGCCLDWERFCEG